ncbi:hypothetical protein LZZ85_18595 [Terrimonas sp. NA20]|uniref:Uncharacterized protein n=1 Tax=Terrimonas ginsenosidimutans TaxID=2908004 RepID=A0ABS9KVJ5_9BACT|nr:hypothetical protein [Terrimonas ginsenosidimutans]MCG2616315.1 hypothetical protein [Terrimonas ginsenosidimutans]
MHQTWINEIRVSDFGQQFRFTAVSEKANRKGTFRFDFSEPERGFVISVEYDEHNHDERYRCSIYPDDALSYPYLIEIFNKYLRPAIEENRNLWYTGQ